MAACTALVILPGDKKKWLVKVYVFVIRLKSLLDQADMQADRKDARYVRYLLNGMAFGAHVVVIGSGLSLET